MVLDITDGLKRIGGNEKIYRIVLQTFYDENRTVADSLEEKMNIRDYGAAIQIVHKIKSSAGNIGAKVLYETASELQQSLSKESGDISQWYHRFKSEFTALYEEIGRILETK